MNKWLEKYSNGDIVQQNYNDVSVSLPEGFVGMGYNTKGRNYSPAWGGQFEEGGEIPQAQFGLLINPIMPLVSGVANKFNDWFGDEPAKKPVKKPAKGKPRTLSIVDPRKKMATTNQPLRPNSDLVGGNYNSNHLDKLMQEAKRQKLSKQDMMNLSAMGFQETKWGKGDGNIGHVLGNWKGNDSYQQFISAYKEKMKEADRLGIKDPATRLQVYNGMGTVTPKTEKNYHGFEMQKIYGVPIPKGGINMKKNPLYGKQVMDIRDNVLAKNPEYVQYMDSIYKAPVPAYMQDVRMNKQKPPRFIIPPIGKKEMGGSIPGAVGFTYARTNDPAPSNGPYAKKTKASAQTGETIHPTNLHPINLHLPKYKKPKPFFTGYGFSQNPVNNVNVYGVGAYGTGNINDRLNLSGNVNSASVFYPGGQKMFMDPRFEVGMKYKFNNGGSMSYYQNGLDWKPKNISKNGGWLNKFDEGGEISPNCDTNALYHPITNPCGYKLKLTPGLLGNTTQQTTQSYNLSNFREPPLANSNSYIQQQIQQKINNTKRVEDNYLKNKILNQPQLKQAKRETPYERERRTALNSSYVGSNQYAALDDDGNITNRIPGIDITGKVYDSKAVRQERMKPLIAAGAIAAGATALPAVVSAATPYVAATSAALNAPLLGTLGAEYGSAALTTNNLINAYFAYEGIKNIPKVVDDWKEVGKSPTLDNVGNATSSTLLSALGILPFTSGVIKGIPSVIQDFNQAGKYLTEQTPLKNAYRLNPFAFKPNSEAYYRMIGNEGAADAFESGIIRAKQNNNLMSLDPDKGFDFTPKQGPLYDRPYFSKGTPFDRDWKSPLSKKKGSIYPGPDMVEVSNASKFDPTNNLVTSPNQTLSAFDPDTKFYTQDWLRGYKEVPKQLPGSPNVVSSVDDVVKQPWKMQELPGLHLKSTMEGEAISKIVEPKTGLINTEQALAIIGKESGGKEKADLIRQALGENVPKKMDFNDFRKTVQDQLIPLERQFSEQSSRYGLGKIGYPEVNRIQIKNLSKYKEEEIERLTNELKSNNYIPLSWDTNDQWRQRLQTQLDNSITELNKLKEDFPKLPIENQTLILSNKGKFGIGSEAHSNPQETLGHIHFLRDAETPNVLTVTQIQSDAFQGTNRTMPKNINEAVSKLDKTKADADYLLESMGDEKEKFKSVFDLLDNKLELDKATVENFIQKSLLDKNHQERYLQELVNYAGERGDLSKIRLPTSETAVKIQNYEYKSADEITTRAKEMKEVNPDRYDKFYNKHKKFFDDIFSGKLKGAYDPDAETILKKYSEQPKTIKKLYGVEPKTVTDSKGNSWYEFDIPKSFKKGKGEIKAFKEGGIIDSDRGQWDHPGKITRIKGGNITMKPDPKTGKALTKPLLGISNTGERKMMYPGQDYQFEDDTEYVTEYPMAKNGVRQEQKGLQNLDDLLNFTNYNKPQPGGWLNKYN